MSRHLARGPVRGVERALAPDLARGFMLLLIVVANTPWYLWGRDSDRLSAHPEAESFIDQVTQGIIVTTVDLRVYPMFAFLFGYGIAMLYQRQIAAGTTEKDARVLLQKRNLWLLVFGFVHALLLWFGDILGAYGLAGLLLVWLFLRRRDGTLIVWSAIGAGLLLALTLLTVASVSAIPEGSEGAEQPFDIYFIIEAANGESNYFASALTRVGFWLFLIFFQGIFSLAVPIAILLGIWAGRRRILEEPAEYLVLLRNVAIAGITIGWLGGGARALAKVGIWEVSDPMMFAFEQVQLATGLAGGVGYVALFGLVGYWLRGRTLGIFGTGIVAVGKRSLSCYLAQSVLCAPILAAWGLGLGQHMYSANMALYAIAVWLITVVGAYILEKRNQRGPAEVVLRRLTYGKEARPSA
ncbi:DUF418 domain-containing protein [Hoyosella altamirensis]|uniref:Putative membrane protein YeiB n=1 Tax=Hoyosella altamirensis TaxID=616997 RepID=A0A839RSK4_9ACTN|nr:DUF418 domain-containing protein [Hoyosella altamirensis]MBB3038841.1 putative membrane protein YeiB [Hoyosella altamirensis]